MNVEPARVVLVDAHVLFREGLERLLSSEPDFRIVGQAGQPAEAIELVAALKPDLVLLDIEMPDGAGLNSLSALLSVGDATTVVVLTNNEADASFFAALRAGAHGYLLKTLTYAKLLTALRVARRGERVLSRQMTNRIVEELARQSQHPNLEQNALKALTAREAEILRHLSSGATNRDIAARLVISEHTVKAHVRKILDKLQLKSRRQVAALAHSAVQPRAA
jgi:DNA-binding NarL/FixJ family response regulator